LQGFFVLAFILNITFLYYPPFGMPKSSIGAWIRDWPNRHWALLAGVICGLGNTFQFMGAQRSSAARPGVCDCSDQISQSHPPADANAMHHLPVDPRTKETPALLVDSS